MKTQEYNLKFDLPLAEHKKTKFGMTMSILTSVKGSLTNINLQIQSSIQDGRKDDYEFWLAEYCKFWLMDKVGVEIYPVVKK